MTDLEKLVERGFLKDNEEVYLSYNKLHFPARIIKGGKFIKNHIGEFKALSKLAGLLIASVDDGANVRHSSSTPDMEIANCNGWKYWVNWKGVSLHDLRKKLNV